MCLTALPDQATAHKFLSKFSQSCGLADTTIFTNSDAVDAAQIFICLSDQDPLLIAMPAPVAYRASDLYKMPAVDSLRHHRRAEVSNRH